MIHYKNRINLHQRIQHQRTISRVDTTIFKCMTKGLRSIQG